MQVQGIPRCHNNPRYIKKDIDSVKRNNIHIRKFEEKNTSPKEERPILPLAEHHFKINTRDPLIIFRDLVGNIQVQGIPRCHNNPRYIKKDIDSVKRNNIHIRKFEEKNTSPKEERPILPLAEHHIKINTIDPLIIFRDLVATIQFQGIPRCHNNPMHINEDIDSVKRNNIQILYGSMHTPAVVCSSAGWLSLQARRGVTASTWVRGIAEGGVRLRLLDGQCSVSTLGFY